MERNNYQIPTGYNSRRKRMFSNENQNPIDMNLLGLQHLRIRNILSGLCIDYMQLYMIDMPAESKDAAETSFFNNCGRSFFMPRSTQIRCCISSYLVLLP